MNNYFLAVTVATIASMIIGYFWYSDFLFGPMWRKLTKVRLSEQDTQRTMLQGFILSFFTAWIFTSLITSMPAGTVAVIRVAFWGWLVFTLPFALQGYVYRKQPVMLIAIDSLYNLTSYVVMAVVIAYFV